MDERSEELQEGFDALSQRRNEGESFENYRKRLKELKAGEKMYIKGRFPWQRANANVTQEQYLELLQNLIEHGNFTGGVGASYDINSGDNESSPDADREYNESIESDGDNPQENSGTE